MRSQSLESFMMFKVNLRFEFCSPSPQCRGSAVSYSTPVSLSSPVQSQSQGIKFIKEISLNKDIHIDLQVQHAQNVNQRDIKP